MPVSLSLGVLRRDRRLLPFALLLVLLTQWLGLCWWASYEERHVLEANRKFMQQMAGKVRVQIGQMFTSTETALRAADVWIAAHPQLDPRIDTGFQGLLEELQRNLGPGAAIRLVGRDGRMLSHSSMLVGADVDVSRSRWFAALRNPANHGLIIDNTDDGRLTGKPGIPLVWPMRLPDSKWQGLFAMIELDSLLKLRPAEQELPNGTVTLMRLDGVLLSRSPYVADFIGKSLRGNPNFAERLARLQQGFYVSDSPSTDHVRRFVSFERVENYPLVAMVTIGEADVLSGWYRQRALVFLLGVALSLTLMALTAGLWLSLRRAQLAAQLLEQQATSDPLTGRYNRRAFFEVAGREFERSRRYAGPLAVLMLDIDFFKRVNDSYGHAVGDIVLRSVAGCWFDALRQEDSIGRIGGEEFAILLPHTSQQDAHALAERLLKLTESLDIVAPAGNFHVTVSIGLAQLMPQDNNFEQLLERADVALYQAKQGGRNRVAGG